MFIASIEFSFIGKGNTPEEAFNDFTGTPFREHCDYYEVKSGTQLEVHIHKGIFPGDPEWSDDIDPKHQWALGEKVDSKTLVFSN
ncbi:hypothetical protein [Rheinheimera sp.]|uniref:hypothetical protein n=1 Tax=Rheinheimera sp. TaxID=1869214 RepID=UPI004048167D